MNHGRGLVTLAQRMNNTPVLTRIAGAQHTDLEARTGRGTSSGNAVRAARDAGVCIPTAWDPPPP